MPLTHVAVHFIHKFCYLVKNAAQKLYFFLLIHSMIVETVHTGAKLDIEVLHNSTPPWLY